MIQPTKWDDQLAGWLFAVAIWLMIALTILFLVSIEMAVGVLIVAAVYILLRGLYKIALHLEGEE